MSKPDDIPQDVWDAARGVVWSFGGAVLDPFHAERVARAILAERERCAGLAANFYGGRAHTYASENADVYMAQDRTCSGIAAAIRGRA